MKFASFHVLSLIIIHLVFGVIFFIFPETAKLLTLVVVVLSLLTIIKSKNKDLSILYASAYVVGAELLLRMLEASFFNEFGKYTITGLALIGIYFNGIKPKAILFIIFIILLVPGIFLGIQNLSHTTEIRKAILFNISGPISLAIFSLYAYGKTITLSHIKNILFLLMLPLVSVLVLIILRVPSVREVITGTASNFETSGGFGPNQVATMLGLSMFCCIVLFMLNELSKKMAILMLVLATIFAFRGLVTFSRGGMITGIIMVLIFVVQLYFKLNATGKTKIILISSIFALFAFSVWSFTSIKTDGLIVNRYANQDAMGRIKLDNLGGREIIFKTEINMFLESPFSGMGVGVNKQYREQTTGIVAASHNEFTRLMAEHGIIGLLALLILLVMPFINKFENHQNIFLWSFFTFWLLTVNHSAMRLAAPSFIYALSLLNIIITPNNLSSE